MKRKARANPLAIERLAQVIEQTDDLSLVTDGERRYGNLLFEICHLLIKQVGQAVPLKVKKGVKVRVKNKGSQSNKRGRKRPKYQTPHREHPYTSQNLDNQDVHANHLEAFNAAELSRRLRISFRGVIGRVDCPSSLSWVACLGMGRKNTDNWD